MKYKEGDKFIIEICGKVKNTLGDELNTLYGGQGEHWIATNSALSELPRYEPPVQAVWRDGAEEQPDGIRDIYVMRKTSDEHIYRLRVENYIHRTTFARWWMYADEFPMPALPEPSINPCFFCDTTEESGDLVCEDIGKNAWSVICGNCGYCSASFRKKQDAIDAHNKVNHV